MFVLEQVRSCDVSTIESVSFLQKNMGDLLGEEASCSHLHRNQKCIYEMGTSLENTSAPVSWEGVTPRPKTTPLLSHSNSLAV